MNISGVWSLNTSGMRVGDHTLRVGYGYLYEGAPYTFLAPKDSIKTFWRGGFVTRLKDGTWAGHIAEHIALELQNLAGTPVHHGKTRSAGTDGQYNVIYEYREEAVGIEAGKVAVRLVNHLVAPTDPAQAFDYVAELEALILLAERQAFGPSTQAILDEAASRDIPFLRLDRASLVQLGQGIHQQRIRATMTSRTSGIAVDIASDKNLTNRLLDSAGLPVPKSEVVRSVDAAIAAAHRVGFPAVIKPLDGNHGRGVQLNLRSDDDVRTVALDVVATVIHAHMPRRREVGRNFFLQGLGECLGCGCLAMQGARP